MDILDFFSRQPIPREVLDYLKKNKGNIYIGNSTNNVNKLLAEVIIKNLTKRLYM